MQTAATAHVQSCVRRMLAHCLSDDRSGCLATTAYRANFIPRKLQILFVIMHAA
jgi:hypothetical protein